LPGGVDENHENFDVWVQILTGTMQETKPPNLDIRLVIYEV
jgi:hypothetical protein